jgi:hypothetical protein
MNLTHFLSQVDQCLNSMDKQSMQKYIHNQARKLSPKSRDGFITELSAFMNKRTPADTDREHFLSLEKSAADICDQLDAIDEDRYLDSEYNPEYDDWYASDEPEILFSDPTRVVPIFDKACGLIAECVDATAYSAAADIIDVMCSASVFVRGDFLDFEGDGELTVDKLDENNLLSADFDKTVALGCFSAYMITPLKDRPEAVYNILSESHNSNVSLENIMQYGKRDLPDFQEFLPLWQKYLSDILRKKTSKEPEDSWLDTVSPGKLLIEAIKMMPTMQQMIEATEKYASEVPESYLSTIEELEQKGVNNDLLYYTENALEKITKASASSLLKTDIADKACEYSQRLGMQDHLDQNLEKLFQINPTEDNYLKLMFHSSDFDGKFRKRAKAIYKNIPNDYHGIRHLSIAFLDGEFDYVLKNGLSFREPLGWSSVFMKRGIALFLLASYKGNTEKMPQSLKTMLHYSDIHLLGEYYTQWHSIRPIPDAVADKAISRIEEAYDARMKAIMGIHRNYYGECADYLAAIGDVKESRGIAGARQRILNHYHTIYKRCRAFTPELKRYVNIK